MTARDVGHATVWLQPPGDAPAGAVLALEAGRVGGLDVARYDLVWTDQVLHHDMSVIVVQNKLLQQYRSTA
jgi:hypothetical protein